MTIEMPCVGIGIPVRNGGELLRTTLRQMTGQTYENVDILVSDNASTDDTAAIVREFAANDSRIRYVRHDPPLTAPENFHYVFDNTRGDYFMWAAHDDLHTANYVETLMAALQAKPDAALAYPDLVDFSCHDPFDGHPLLLDLTSETSTPFFQRLVKVTRRGAHLYGLHRRAVIQGWNWPACDYGWDTPLLAFIAARGAVIKASGATFMNFRPANHRLAKSPQARSLADSYRRVAPFYAVRWVWKVVQGGRLGEASQGRRRGQLTNFLRLYLFHIWWPRARRKLYEIAPERVIALWRRLKGGASSPATP